MQTKQCPCSRGSESFCFPFPVTSLEVSPASSRASHIPFAHSLFVYSACHGQQSRVVSSLPSSQALCPALGIRSGNVCGRVGGRSGNGGVCTRASLLSLLVDVSLQGAPLASTIWPGPEMHVCVGGWSAWAPAGSGVLCEASAEPPTQAHVHGT